MSNYTCVFSYVGTNFNGSAEQLGTAGVNVRTVMGCIRTVIEMVVQKPVAINLAGRTDRGVHARAQVANFSLDSTIDVGNLSKVINGRLAPEIVVHSIEEVNSEFHARFSAKARTYRYYIYNAKNPHPFYSAFSWHIYNDLNFDDMVEASKYFIGEHDFTTFCRTNPDVKHNIREVKSLDFHMVNKKDDLFEIAELETDTNSRLMCLEIQANAFCWQMVRSITGTLVDVGRGKVAPSQISEMLDMKDRNVTKQLAPPHGLTLYSIEY